MVADDLTSAALQRYLPGRSARRHGGEAGEAIGLVTMETLVAAVLHAAGTSPA